MRALEPGAKPDTWHIAGLPEPAPLWRRCENFDSPAGCNWLVAEDDAEPLRGRFINDPSGTVFQIPTSAVDNKNGEFSIGVSAVFAEGRSAFFSYRRQFGVDNIQQDFWSVGGRLEF